MRQRSELLPSMDDPNNAAPYFNNRIRKWTNKDAAVSGVSAPFKEFRDAGQGKDLFDAIGARVPLEAESICRPGPCRIKSGCTADD